MPTVSYAIANTADDVIAYTFGGPVSIDTSTPANGVNGVIFHAGFRFLGVAVPQGATITAATLTVKKDTASSTAGAWGALKGVATDNAPAWATVNPIDAIKTAQSVTIVDGATQVYDVAAIVQAIVNRPGWSSGNALAFAGDPTGATGAMAWTDYGVSSANAAQLSITYDSGGPDVTAPTITSSATPSVVEGSALSHALTANETVTWTKVGGANAAAFTLTGSTLSLPAQTYPSGPFVVIVRATDTAGNWTEQTITVSVTATPPISFVGQVTGTTTAAMPAHQVGDLILCWAYRDGSNTLPTLASAGWTTLNGVTGANTNSAYLVGKIAASSSEAVGTFTSATSVVVAVYRPKAGYTASFGAVAAATGTSTTVSYPALTLQDTDGSSWVAGFAGHRSVNTTLESPPTGMVNRATVVDATDEAAAHDTNGGVASWSAQTVSVGGTSSGWRAATVEIKVAAAGANGNANGASLTATSSLVLGSASAVRNASATGTTLTATSGLSAGSASGIRNATQPGPSLTLTASLAEGSASASQSGAASGQALVAIASLTGGAASGVRSPSTLGQTLTTTANLASGAASAVRSPSVLGQTLTATASLTTGAASGVRSASPTGVSFMATASIVAGSAAAGAIASGANPTASASLLSGVVSGQASVSGQTWTVSASLTEGSANGGATGQASGATLIAYASFAAGLAAGQRNASASGQAVTATTSLFAGVASASSGAAASGANLAVAGTLTDGTPSGSARATGSLLSLSATLTSEGATGDAVTSGFAWTTYASLVPGAAGSGADVVTPPARRANALAHNRSVAAQPGSSRLTASAAQSRAAAAPSQRRHAAASPLPARLVRT